jgi:hypothetical protein
MTAAHPVEFATELLLPFALDAVRESEDPWGVVVAVRPPCVPACGHACVCALFYCGGCRSTV